MLGKVKTIAKKIYRALFRSKSKKTNRLKLYETATGKYFLPVDAKADHIARTIRKNQVFDQDIVDLFEEFIQPGTVALDVGSNFGQMAVMMSMLVGNRGKVYAFEADDFLFDILTKNCQANSSSIEPIFGAVHSVSGETLYFPEPDFERFGTYGSHGIDYTNGTGRPVPTIAIDDIDFAAPVSFMKVDVQGGDLLAMRGARETISKYRMPIVFEYEYLFEKELGLKFQEYVDFVQEIDYKFVRVINGQNYLVLPSEAV